ncbi:hypothetical protein D3C74_456720 [compost metagenome]
MVYSSNFKTIPLLIAASLWYLAITSLLSLGQFYIERHFNRGSGNRTEQKLSSRFNPLKRSQPTVQKVQL